jgi:MFS family permease
MQTTAPMQVSHGSGSMTLTRRRYLIMALLFVTVVINYLDRSNLSIAASSSLLWLGLAAGCFILPWRSDRIHRRKPPILVGTSIQVACLAMLLYVPSFGPCFDMALATAQEAWTNRDALDRCIGSTMA